MPATVSADVPWMAVDPTKLDPSSVEQTVSIQVDADDVPLQASEGRITIHTAHGERAEVVVTLQRSGPGPIVASAVAAALLLAVGASLALLS